MKTLSGRSLALEVEAEETVEQLKERIQESEGISPCEQRLIFAGKQLEDDQMVLECARKDANLHLVARLRASGKNYVDQEVSAGTGSSSGSRSESSSEQESSPEEEICEETKGDEMNFEKSLIEELKLCRPRKH